MRKIKNKREKLISLIAIFQLVLLIGMIPAESYTIHQSDSSSEISIVNYNKNKIRKTFDAGISLLIGFFSIKEIGIVSAAVEGACCLDTCDNVIPDYTGCSQELVPTTCEDTDECQLGCCVDTEEGICTVNSPKGKCESKGGDWNSGTSCSISACKEGCCVLENTAKFMTQQNCKTLSSGNMDFRQISYESCFNIFTSQFEGACVFSSGNCKFGTEAQCISDKGSFYEGYLCSYESLNTNCKKQDSIGCVEGKNEIYWFDSCGNRENIYSSDKTVSWNEGSILAKENSCNIVDSTNCGNCASASSMCSATKTGETHVADGNFFCKDLSCKNAPDNVGTKDRSNGENWCLYDGYIGEGKDTVGSEHYLAMCVNGKVEVDRCGEYRTSLCQQRKIESESDSYTTSNCVPNQAIKCHSITNNYFGTEMDEGDLEVMKEKCNKEEHCTIKNVEISEYFKFSTCVPKYTTGDILTDAYDGGICEWASRDCAVYYEKDFWGNWVAKENKECETPEFAKQMNELCISIGDCGSYVNYLGEGTDSVKLTGRKGKVINSTGAEIETESSLAGNAPAIYNWTNYIDYSNTKEGQFVEPLDTTEELEGILGKDYTPEKLNEWLWTIPGAVGSVILGAQYLFSDILKTNIFKTIFTFDPVGPPGQIASAPTVLGGIFTMLWTTVIGVETGFILGSIFNRSPEATIWLMTTGGILGGAVGSMFYFAEVAGTAGPIGFWISAGIGFVALILLGIEIFTGFGERETRIVEFKCLPWVAPSGGDNCEKCDDDPARPCTKYKCESLGQLCKLKNENEENPLCVSLPRENIPPIISAEKVKTEGYEFKNEKTEDGGSVEIAGCIEEFEDIWFTLNTDEYSQCKYSFKRPTSAEYDLMQGELPDEGNLFTTEHNFFFKIPTIDNENIYSVQEIDGGITKEGKLDVYVKCQDGQEPANFNIREYAIRICVRSGPDEREVSYTRMFTEPANGAILKYGTTDVNLKLWTNEKVESCKYDTTADKSYENMLYTFDVGTKDYRGWLSSTQLTNLIAGGNKYYIKCKDLSGNINLEDLDYSLSVSKSDLTISSVNFSYGVKKISAGGVFDVGLEPVSIDMQVKTSGGAQNGKAQCFWGIAEAGTKWSFKKTFSNVHEQVLSPRFEGTYENYIYCIDDAENNASGIVDFTIGVDSSPPRITRAFKDGGSLKITTDELAKCYYGLNGCNFNLEDGIPMTQTFSKTHSTSWNQGITYNIKCEDIFGNINPDCGMKVIPSL